jgi:hypothetical protein
VFSIYSVIRERSSLICTVCIKQLARARAPGLQITLSTEGGGMSGEVRRVTGMCEGQMRGFGSLYFFYYFLSIPSSFLSLLEGTHSNFLCYLSRVTLM